MSGETEANVSAQTVDTLHHEIHGVDNHLRDILAEKDLRYQQRFEAQTLAINAAMAAAEKAVSKAEAANERRFDAVNEFRATLADQAGQFVTKVELNGLVERFTDLVARVDRSEGKSGGMDAAWGYLFGAAGIATAVVALVVR